MMATLADWLPDIRFGNLFILLLVLFVGASMVVNGQKLLEQLRHDGTARLYHLAGFFGGLFMAGGLSYAMASNTRRDHWLRAGTSRYTVATVTRSYYSRSGRKFVFTYRAGARRHETNGECGTAPCPRAGARRFVRFAAEAPDVCQVLDAFVPDTLSLVPSGGWAKLPGGP